MQADAALRVKLPEAHALVERAVAHGDGLLPTLPFIRRSFLALHIKDNFVVHAEFALGHSTQVAPSSRLGQTRWCSGRRLEAT